MTIPPVPYPAHLAFFTFFPIWGKVKNRIFVATKNLTLKAIGRPMELGAVAPDAGERYPGLPGRKPN